jgi:hypothetical protein
MKECPKCGYIPPKNKVGKPRNFTIEEEKQIVEDRKKMTLMEVANKWSKIKGSCSIGTVQNIVKRHLT